MKNILYIFFFSFTLTSCVWDAVDTVIDLVDPPEEMPKWKPGQVDGKNVSVRCRIPLVFTLE